MLTGKGMHVVVVGEDHKIAFRPVVLGHDFGRQVEIVDGIDADLVLPYGWAATAERPAILDELADGLRASQGQNPCTGHRARSTARRRAGASRTLLV